MAGSRQLQTLMAKKETTTNDTNNAFPGRDICMSHNHDDWRHWHLFAKAQCPPALGDRHPKETASALSPPGDRQPGSERRACLFLFSSWGSQAPCRLRASMYYPRAGRVVANLTQDLSGSNIGSRCAFSCIFRLWSQSLRRLSNCDCLYSWRIFDRFISCSRSLAL